LSITNSGIESRFRYTLSRIYFSIRVNDSIWLEFKCLPVQRITWYIRSGFFSPRIRYNRITPIFIDISCVYKIRSCVRSVFSGDEEMCGSSVVNATLINV